MSGDLQYEEQPIQILDRKEQKLRNKTTPLVLVKLKFHADEELTCERESYMRGPFPYPFGE